LGKTYDHHCEPQLTIDQQVTLSANDEYPFALLAHRVFHELFPNHFYELPV